MAAPSQESNILSELQRAAFEKWKDSKNYMDLEQRSHPTSDVGGEDFDCHVDVTLNIRENGNVDVSLNASGRQEPPHASQLQDFLFDMPNSPYLLGDPVNKLFVGDNEGGMKGNADLSRPQKLYLYSLELQRLKAIINIEPNTSSKCGSPKIPYDGGLSELQRAAFERWSNDMETDPIATKKIASENLKDYGSMQPTMSTLKGDTNSVHELEPLLSNFGL